MSDLIPNEQTPDIDIYSTQQSVYNPLTKIQPLVFSIIGTATRILVRVLNFHTYDKTCTLYFELQDETGKTIYNGNYTLSSSEFSTWASDNSYLEDLVCNYLGVVKDVQ